VPAGEIAGRILASKGESRQASRIIARTWKLSPHPDLAIVYAFAKPGEPPRERVKRVKQLASLTPGDVEGQIAIATAAIEAHEWQEARNALEPYLDGRPSARICMLMARIESGELGDKGREREWLARALRAPRDRAWIADGYVSDRWLPVSPVTGAVDAFEWKAPMDAIGRGDDTLIIEERPQPVTVSAQVLAPFAPPRAETARLDKKDAGEIVDVSPRVERERPAATEAPPPPKTAAQEMPRSPAEQRLKPAIFVPERPPDDPGVAQTETDESPTSLERLRAAQIR
jgi:HemY protein